MERLAFPLHEALGNVVKRVDLEIYGTFRAITLKEGKELEDNVSGAAKEDQLAINEMASQFFEVRPTSNLINHRCLKTMNQVMRR